MIKMSLLRNEEILKAMSSQVFIITRTFRCNYVEVYGEFKGLVHTKNLNSVIVYAKTFSDFLFIVEDKR